MSSFNHEPVEMEVDNDSDGVGSKVDKYSKGGERHVKRHRDEWKETRRMLTATKPSLALKLDGNDDIRKETRERLIYLLTHLMKRHNWEEASLVLFILFKATRDFQLSDMIRFNYSAAMEILRRGNIPVTKDDITAVFDPWLKRLKYQNQPKLDVLCEVLFLCISEKEYELAEQYERSLSHAANYEKHPRCNLALGLFYFWKWSSTIEENKKKKNASCMDMGSDIYGTNSSETNSSNQDEAGSYVDSHSQWQTYSETSVMNNKDAADHDGGVQRTRCTHQPAQSFYQNSSEMSGQGRGSLQFPYPPIEARRLKSSLWPLLFSKPIDALSDIVASDVDDTYNKALEHLQRALHSVPRVSELASRPLMQLLLLGDQVDHFLELLERLCHTSYNNLPLRVKAKILESFSPNQTGDIATLYEDALKKDPTSKQSVAGLLNLHQAGNYSAEKLLDRLGLHLDGVGVKFSYWREFAACLVQLCEQAGDAMSTCLDGPSTVCYRSVPAIFSEGWSGMQWKETCKCWLYKHFQEDILDYDVALGDLPRLTYKATCASYFYGSTHNYVQKVYPVVEHDPDMLEYLIAHAQNFVGFYPDMS